METLPPEIVTRVFMNLPCLTLAQNFRVCKDWNAILSDTTSIWRNLGLNYTKSLEERQSVMDEFQASIVLMKVNLYSRWTLEIVMIILQSWLSSPYPGRVHPIMIELKLSQNTLKRVEVWIKSNHLVGSQTIFSFFRTFPNLSILNLTGCPVREVKQINPYPGRLTALGLHLAEENFVWDEEDLKWLSTLKSLLVVSDTSIVIGPTGAFVRLVDACGESLDSLSAGFIPPDAELSLSLPNLKSFFTSQRVLSLESFDFPSLREVGGTPQNLSTFSLGNIRSIEMNIEGIEYVGEEERDRSPSVEDLLQPLRDNNHSLKQLKIYSSSPEHRQTSIDSLLFYLLKLTGRDATCPNLVKIYISEEQVYSLTLLIVMMISRRLDSKLEDRKSCLELNLYLPLDRIEEFRALETEFLRMKTSELAGSSIVRKLSEWDSE